jgi:hypothetical protein
VYVPDVGFVARDSSLLLKQPIFQEHEGQTVTVTRGVATERTITLFLEFNDVAHPVNGAWLETVSGQQLNLLQWEYFPNTPDSHGVKMIFLLSPWAQGITLFPIGRLAFAIEWILSQSNLPDIQVVPFDPRHQQLQHQICVLKRMV